MLDPQLLVRLQSLEHLSNPWLKDGQLQSSISTTTFVLLYWTLRTYLITLTAVNLNSATDILLRDAHANVFEDVAKLARYLVVGPKQTIY